MGFEQDHDLSEVKELFTPVQLGSVHAENRIVLAPLTRRRSGEDGVPGELVAEYYRQRASTGMIITEGTWPISEGRTWIGQPGIETREQQKAWAHVAEVVHDAGGKIAMQIMHGGRVSHPLITGTGRIVSPSATAGPNPIQIPGGAKADPPVAQALTVAEIKTIITQFVDASYRAMDAGLDAVQLHGANGYLINQFFSPAANLRTDSYGGSPTERARFAIELTEAAANAIGAENLGVRVSPGSSIQGMNEFDEAETLATYLAFAEGIGHLGLGSFDVLHQDPGGHLVQELRRAAGAPLIANTGFEAPTTRTQAAAIIANGWADAVAVGRALIPNPDLVRRWREQLPEEPVTDEVIAGYYTGGAAGYTDYRGYEG